VHAPERGSLWYLQDRGDFLEGNTPVDPQLQRRRGGRGLRPGLDLQHRRPRGLTGHLLGLDLEAVRKGSWKLRLDDGTLYNLATDLGEKSDVAANHPDIVAELRALAAAADADLGQTGIGPGCRPLGRVKNPQPLIPFDNPPKP